MNKENENGFSPFENISNDKDQKLSDLFIKVYQFFKYFFPNDSYFEKETHEEKLISSISNRNNLLFINSKGENLKYPNVNEPAISSDGTPEIKITIDHNYVNNNLSQESNIDPSALNNNNNYGNNNRQGEHERPLEVLNIENQGILTTNEITDEELRKSQAILNSALMILSIFLIICFIFYIYFEIQMEKEILFLELIAFEFISLMITLLNKNERKKFLIVERMNIFLVTVIKMRKLERFIFFKKRD